MLSSKSTSYNCNFVHQDKIWKDHVKLELESQKKWPENWGFLEVKKTEEQRQEKESKIEKEEGKKYPKTTAGQIGYKTTELPSYQWEKRYGKSAKGKGGIDKLLGWPLEAI